MASVKLLSLQGYFLPVMPRVGFCLLDFIGLILSHKSLTRFFYKEPKLISALCNMNFISSVSIHLPLLYYIVWHFWFMFEGRQRKLIIDAFDSLFSVFLMQETWSVTPLFWAPCCFYPYYEAASPNAILPIATHFSAAWSLCLSHSCALLKLLDGFRSYLAGTLVGFNDALC